MPYYAYRCFHGNGIPEFERRDDHLYVAGGWEPVATIIGDEIYIGHGAASIPDAVVTSDGRVHAGPSPGVVIFAVVGNQVRAGGAMGEELFWAPNDRDGQTDVMTLAATALVTIGDSRLRKTGRDDTHASQLGGMPEIWEKHWKENGYHDTELYRTDDLPDNPEVDSEWPEREYSSDWHSNFAQNHDPVGWIPPGPDPSAPPDEIAAAEDLVGCVADMMEHDPEAFQALLADDYDDPALSKVLADYAAKHNPEVLRRLFAGDE